MDASLTGGFYDTRPQRSGRRKCCEYYTKGSRLERNRGCAAVSIGENVIEAIEVHDRTILQARAAFA